MEDKTVSQLFYVRMLRSSGWSLFFHGYILSSYYYYYDYYYYLKYQLGKYVQIKPWISVVGT